MALTRVQSTGKTTTAANTLTLSFTTPPVMGHAIAVGMWTFNGNVVASATCTDNRGNVYTAAKGQANSVGAVVFFCAAVTATGTPFTITITVSAATYLSGCAVEISGVGIGLVVNQAGSATGTFVGFTAAASTPALTAPEVFAVGVMTNLSSNTFLTVESVTPPWTQEAEEIVVTPQGEMDTRVVTGGVGAPTSVSWLSSHNSQWVAVLVAFAARPALVLQTTDPPSGVVGTPYTTTITAVGGVGAKSFSIVGGALPAGLTLNGATGAITGTPTMSLVTSFTLQVADSDVPPQYATQTYAITIAELTHVVVQQPMRLDTTAQLNEMTLDSMGGAIPMVVHTRVDLSMRSA